MRHRKRVVCGKHDDWTEKKESSRRRDKERLMRKKTKNERIRKR